MLGKGVMQRILILIISLLFSSSVFADSGYVYKADLNGDGAIDSIRSGPQYMFGNGGGPFLISLSANDGKYVEAVIGLQPTLAVFEKNGSKSKVWGYWHWSAHSGKLESTILDGSFKSESLTLNFDDSPDGLSKKIFNLIFQEEHLIKFDKIDNYTPPNYSWGK